MKRNRKAQHNNSPVHVRNEARARAFREIIPQAMWPILDDAVLQFLPLAEVYIQDVTANPSDEDARRLAVMVDLDGYNTTDRRDALHALRYALSETQKALGGFATTAQYGFVFEMIHARFAFGGSQAELRRGARSYLMRRLAHILLTHGSPEERAHQYGVSSPTFLSHLNQYVAEFDADIDVNDLATKLVTHWAKEVSHA